MHFEKICESVAFEFVYKNYTISIADYVFSMDERDTLTPKKQITVLIEKYGVQLGESAYQLIADYVNFRIKGSISHEGGVLGGVLGIYLQPHDQFMLHFMNALEVVLPR